MARSRRRTAGHAADLAKVDPLPTQYLECRTIGHAWKIRWWGNITAMPDDLVPDVVRSFRWDLVRVSTCLRCTTIRDEFYPAPRAGSNEWDPYRVQYRRYRYASGYQVEGGAERGAFTQAAYERWQTGDPDFM